MGNYLSSLVLTLGAISALMLLSGERSYAANTGNCAVLSRDLKLPTKLKTRGKPPRARWEKVDEVVSKLRGRIEGTSCSWTLGQLFRPTKKQPMFPLTNNLLRTVPDAVLEGVEVFNQQGIRLGQYANRVMYQRSGGLYSKKKYTLYYFQYKDANDKLQSSGSQLLLDTYLVRWDDIKNRVSIAAESAMALGNQVQ